MITRRNFMAGALASVFSGVTVGVHTYSFRDRPLDKVMAALVELGVTECDLGGIHIEPPRKQANYAEALRKFRLTVPLDQFEKIGAQFRAAGIRIANYTYNYNAAGPDEELDRGFEMAKALGAKSLAMTTRVSFAPQIDRAARRHKMRAGLHNHSRIQPDQLATPDDFAAALQGSSDYLSITLDAGHYFAAGFDPVEFIRANHTRILSLHLKDRKKNQGATVPYGEGDTPIVALLQLIRDKKYAIPAYIEHEYEGGDPVADESAVLAGPVVGDGCSLGAAMSSVGMTTAVERGLGGISDAMGLFATATDGDGVAYGKALQATVSTVIVARAAMR
jgi:sugar phosphate isomerase/epimerase